jgi:hypothetical protein
LSNTRPLTNPAPNGYYSGGTGTYGQVTGGAGQITTGAVCPSPSPSITPTVTPSLTPTRTPSLTPSPSGPIKNLVLSLANTTAADACNGINGCDPITVGFTGSANLCGTSGQITIQSTAGGRTCFDANVGASEPFYLSDGYYSRIYYRIGTSYNASPSPVSCSLCGTTNATINWSNIETASPYVDSDLSIAGKSYAGPNSSGQFIVAPGQSLLSEQRSTTSTSQIGVYTLKITNTTDNIVIYDNTVAGTISVYTMMNSISFIPAAGKTYSIAATATVTYQSTCTIIPIGSIGYTPISGPGSCEALYGADCCNLFPYPPPV